MIQANHAGQTPKIHATAFVHPSAVVIGNVVIGKKVFVGPNAVIRSDEPGACGNVESIIIEGEVNIQDCVVIHASGGSRVRIGKGAEIKDYVIIRTYENPVVIGEYVQINPFTVIYGGSGVQIGNNVMIAPHCMIAAGDHDFRQTEKRHY